VQIKPAVKPAEFSITSIPAFWSRFAKCKSCASFTTMPRGGAPRREICLAQTLTLQAISVRSQQKGPFRQNLSSVFQKNVLVCPRPASTRRGVSADRHERGKQDAVDVSAQQGERRLTRTSEVVWSRSPDAGINPRVKSLGGRRLVLLDHKFSRLLGGLGCLQQHWHRCRVAAIATASLRWMVAIELGTWRCGRIGGAAGSVTTG